MVTNCPQLQKLCAGYVLMAIPHGPRRIRASYKRWTPFLNQTAGGKAVYILDRPESCTTEPVRQWTANGGNRLCGLRSNDNRLFRLARAGQPVAAVGRRVAFRSPDHGPFARRHSVTNLSPTQSHLPDLPRTYRAVFSLS